MWFHNSFARFRISVVLASPVADRHSYLCGHTGHNRLGSQIGEACSGTALGKNREGAAVTSFGNKEHFEATNVV